MFTADIRKENVKRNVFTLNKLETMSEKFKVGDRVRVIDVNPPQKTNGYVVTGYSENGNRVLVEGGFGYHEHRLQLLKPLTDLWRDENTCRKITELMGLLPRYENTVRRGPEDSEYTSIVFIYSQQFMYLNIDDDGQAYMANFKIPFLKLTQLLTERGYYPVEE